MMGARTSLKCTGCGATENTPAVRPEDWPEDWFIDGPLVWHSKMCRTNVNEKMKAHRRLSEAVESIEPGCRDRLIELANTVIKESGSKQGAHCELAFLMRKLFDPKKI